MSIPYRTRRVLNRLGIVLMIFLLVGVIAWLCWVVWLERYVVYTAFLTRSNVSPRAPPS